MPNKSSCGVAQVDRVILIASNFNLWDTKFFTDVCIDAVHGVISRLN
jgi:hypothetical protein